MMKCFIRDEDKEDTQLGMNNQFLPYTLLIDRNHQTFILSPMQKIWKESSTIVK
jgi:hypothetical protein